MLSVFLVSIITVVALSIFWYVISLARGRNDVADIGWGTYFMGPALVHFFMNNPAFDVRIIPIVLVLIWGIRLSSHIFTRHLHTTEDARYVAWRNAWGNGWYFYVRSFVQVFLLQGILAMVIATPVILITSKIIPLNLVWVIIGTAVWIGGFICESVADAQLKTFLANPINKGHIMQTGLWKYSRHPNYFGEVTQWWGIFIIGLGTTLGILGIIGPLVITFLIVFVSGIPLAEKSMAKNPEFEDYKNKTSSLIPLPYFLVPEIPMKTLASIAIEFGPLILFFITFEIFNFMTSVAILIGTMIVALIGSIKIYGKIAFFPLIASGSVIVFGILTIVLDNPFFIIFKDTLYFGIFALGILIPTLFKQLVLKKMFGQIFDITDKGWFIVSMNWGFFMALIAISNEIARILLSAPEWVTYKFIVLIILIVFGGAQFLISRYYRNATANSWGLKIN